MIQFISDKISAMFRVLNFDNKKYNTTHGNRSPIVQGNNNKFDFSFGSTTSRKQLINNVIVLLEKLDDNKVSSKACAPILSNLEDNLRKLRVDLEADEYHLQQIVEKLLLALKNNQFADSQTRAIFEVFDSNWHPSDKINFKSYFESTE